MAVENIIRHAQKFYLKWPWDSVELVRDDSMTVCLTAISEDLKLP